MFFARSSARWWIPVMGCCLEGMTAAATGLPDGMSVRSGSASTSLAGQQLTVTASDQSFLNWRTFDIQSGAGVRFVQPGAQSIVWNRVDGAQVSHIDGRLEANGVVVLMNSAGFHFGSGAFVNAAGLVVSTAPVTPMESNAGLFWQFSGAPPHAAIINYGHLRVESGGGLFLIGDRIENHGTLEAPGGRVGLMAGDEVLLSSRPDGLGLSASVRLPSGSVDNQGQILADAGVIALHAKVVNQGGLIQADTVRERNGVIELVAAESAHLEGDSTTSARGPAGGTGDAGRIVIRSSGAYSDEVGARVDVSGGTSGGAGGVLEVSAPRMNRLNARFDGGAKAGAAGGRFVLDPQDIVLANSGSGSPSDAVAGGGDPRGTLALDVNAAFQGFSQIDLQATRNITIAAGTAWNLAASTGLNEPGSLLRLQAGNNITIANGASLVAGENWSVSLEAGRDLSDPAKIVPGVGNITLSGAGSIEAVNGSLHLAAGNNITVGSGFVRTIGGGSIEARAWAGSINTGTRVNGFRFLPSGYQVDAELGGISTANGGDVTIAAGLDVLSYLPVSGGIQTDGGSGAFGAAPGQVHISAGRDVAGHFVARNGQGTVEAGRDAGTPARLLALSLVSGGWAVSAGRDALIQEIRNPNGVFNNLGSSASANRHRFDYALDAYLRINAAESVQLRGSALPRYSDTFEQGIPPIYPGRLEIQAGAGGIVLGNDVVLSPSPVGQLSLTTRDGGDLVGGRTGDLTRLILSDSGKSQYRAFGDFGIADHATTPLHLSDPDPVRLRIDGDMAGILLGSAKRVEIEVRGDMRNSRLEAQNLHANDRSWIHVGGDILNRNEFTSAPVESEPNFGVFDLVYPPLTGNAAGVQNQLSYDSATRSLTFQGRMTGDQLQALLNLRIRTFDSNGFPVVDGAGEPVTEPASFAPAPALEALFNGSQDVPLNPDTGYRIGGGGLLEIVARNLDLGATVGIVSQGPRANPALAQTLARGADLSLSLSGNLDMFSTKIATLQGGRIDIAAEGEVNVGSRTFKIGDGFARGIFTTDPSDVRVIARGSIHVNGSRIAAYDGGNVVVRSLEGDVDAGTGGNGAATVEKIMIDPDTRAIRTYAPTIPGSGILATSFPRPLDPAFPPSTSTVGDILVEAPRGNILASAGGVVQIPLNGIGANVGNVVLRAGSRDAGGAVLHRGSIDASGSGVIGSNVEVDATGDIVGVIFARQNLDLKAQQNITATVLAGGSAEVSGGGTVSGTIVGIGNASVSAASVDASILSQNVSTSGDASAAQTGFAQGTAANASSQAAQTEDVSKTATASKSDEEEEKKRPRRELPAVTRTVGRVTVILPAKN